MSSIAIVLTPHFADWEYALIAGTGGPFYGLDVRFFGSEAGTLDSQGGLSVVTAHGLKDLPSWKPQVVVVVGGMVWETDAAPDVSDLLIQLYREGATIAGICGGTIALARSGLLDHVRHTSNGAEFLTKNAIGYEGSQGYTDSATAIVDGRVITAPGTGPVSFTASVFLAAGLSDDTVAQFREMMAAEHA